MSYKSENWKEKLEQVRNHIALKEGSVEKTADEILESQIEEELNTFDDIQEVTDKEIKGVKQLSKLIEKAKKDYQKIVKSGDQTLRDTKFNEKYEIVKLAYGPLDAAAYRISKNAAKKLSLQFTCRRQ